MHTVENSLVVVYPALCTRRLVFTVKASDDCGIIGEGRHERFVINNEKFMAKINAKIGLDKE